MMESNRELNLNVKSESGWCLWFTQEVFRVPHLYPSATSAWNNTKFRHYDRNLPDAPVPIWFELWGNYGTPPKYDNWGHVATWVPGKGILSSPVTFSTTGQQWFQSIDEVIRAMRGGKYLGWSEDISNVRVVVPKEESMIQNTDDEFTWTNAAMQVIEGKGVSREYFAAHIVGRKFYDVVKDMLGSPDAAAKIEAFNRQPEPIIKTVEVEKIVEKPVEVIKEVPTIDTETQENVKETLKTVKSVKGMLVNFIGWIKNKLGR